MMVRRRRRMKNLTTQKMMDQEFHSIVVPVVVKVIMKLENSNLMLISYMVD